MPSWGFGPEKNNSNDSSNATAGVKAGNQAFVHDQKKEKRNVIATNKGWVRREHRLMNGGTASSVTRQIDEVLVAAGNKDGAPSKVPRELYEGGTLMTIGGNGHGHKGSALSMMVDVLGGILSGTGPSFGVDLARRPFFNNGTCVCLLPPNAGGSSSSGGSGGGGGGRTGTDLWGCGLDGALEQLNVSDKIIKRAQRTGVNA